MAGKKNMRFRDLRVGIFVIGAIGVLIFLILNASGDISPFSRKLKLRAQFSNADGLRPGSEVRLAGVRIGKVDKVELMPAAGDRGARVEATMSIDSEIHGKPATDLIRTDSTASLGSPSLLGSDKLVNVSPGTAVGEAVPNNYLLPLGRDAKGFDALTESGTELTQQLNKLSKEFTDIAERVNRGEGTIGRFINDEAFYNNLNAAVRDTQSLVRQIQSGEGTAGRLVNDPALYNNLNEISQQLNAIASDLRAGRGTAGRLLTDDALYNDLRSTVARFNRSVDEINLVVTDLRAGRGTAGKLLTDEAIYNDARAAIARVNTAAERFDNIMTGVQRGDGTVGKLFTDDQLYSNFNQLSSESVKLIYDFRQNPKKYLTIKFELF
jgi:phospholipid/cholesterol/gamma-HCH transport system substrate-binding protein